MKIRTNVPSLNAHRNLKNVGLGQMRASQRLSSGFRINSAADDAAGLAISETMRAQIRGLDKAWRNAQDGIALIQTAEGGIATINEMIIRIRELVVQAANDTYVHGMVYDFDAVNNLIPDSGNMTSQRAMIQQEIDQLVAEIDAVTRRVEFNTMRLLDGSVARSNSSSMSTQIDASTLLSDTIILPTSQQIANDFLALLNPDSTIESITPLATPPTPTRTISASNLMDGGADWSFSGGLLTITGIQVFEIDGASLGGTVNRIAVDGGLNLSGTNGGLILNNVDIPMMLPHAFEAALDIRTAEVDLWLVGENRLVGGSMSAGIRAVEGSTLRINGTGTLTAIGRDGAGIGGGFFENGGTIYINGGTIDATGCLDSAGIGGGFMGNGGNITIAGGTVTARSSMEQVGFSHGAGIGGGLFGNSGNISITGGIVTAYGSWGAGIGSGQLGNSENIYISGGTIVANVLADPDFPYYVGAGIGGGMGSDGGVIIITGGVITANNEGNGAAIGGGGDGGIPSGAGSGANLTITGGLLQIAAGQWIGAGHDGTNHGTATITGGNMMIGSTSQIYGLISPQPPFLVEVSFNPATSFNNADVTIDVDGAEYHALTSSTGQLFILVSENMVDDIVTMDINGRNFIGRIEADGTLTLTEVLALDSVGIVGIPQVGETLTATHSPTGASPVPEFRWYRVDVEEVARLEADAMQAEIDYGTGSSEHLTVLAALETARLGVFLGDGSNLNLTTAELGYSIVLRTSQDDGLGNMHPFPVESYVGPIIPADANGPTEPPNGGQPIPTGGRGLWFQLGANANQGVTLYIEALDAYALGLMGIAGSPLINVLHESGVDISPILNILDAALSIATSQRAALGAMQNRLEFTSRGLSISSENLSDSENRIRNADMAREMMAFTMSNVLQQAGVSMLAQANQLPEAILQLLR